MLSSFLHSGNTEQYEFEGGRGIYLYVLEGRPVTVNNITVPTLGSAMITTEQAIDRAAERDAEFLLVEVKT